MHKEKQDFFLRLHKEQKLIAPAVAASFLSWLLLDVSSEEVFREANGISMT